MKAPKGLLPGEIPKHLNFVSGTARYFDAYNADFNFTLKKWQSKKNIKDIQAMKYNSASWIIKFSFTSSQKFVNSTRKHRPWLLPGNVVGACESTDGWLLYWMYRLWVCSLVTKTVGIAAATRSPRVLATSRVHRRRLKNL